MVDVLTFRLLSRLLCEKNHACMLYTLLGKCGAFDVDMLFNQFFVSSAQFRPLPKAVASRADIPRGS